MNIKTLPEAAQILEINSKTLRQAVDNGRIPATKSGRAWLIDLDNEQVLAYKANLKPKKHLTPDETMPVCKVCGKPVLRRRAKYCSQECYGKTF